MPVQTVRAPAIDLGRLRAEMTELGKIGRIDGERGINRPGYSDADMEARAFMAERMEATGLTVSTDSVGNLSGLWPAANGKRVLVGSHLDTVPNGGFFDGALGVCAALECVRSMKDAGIAPQRPIEVIATAEEKAASAACSARRRLLEPSTRRGFVRPPMKAE